ncbi:hypothetical protein Sjap_005317 [Stephania japonica]|uniref:Uncharacterized protein n=1 Tax=Stephania japonica TaxID=461633 RepID=A0AAP0K5D2_9MAGN
MTEPGNEGLAGLHSQCRDRKMSQSNLARYLAAWPQFPGVARVTVLSGLYAPKRNGMGRCERDQIRERAWDGELEQSRPGRSDDEFTRRNHPYKVIDGVNALSRGKRYEGYSLLVSSIRYEFGGVSEPVECMYSVGYR